MPIVVERLSHAYLEGSPLAFPALKEIDLVIEEGSFLGVIGHTGSGKTTLVQHLNGLLLPTDGRVLVDGLDTRDKKQRVEARRLVGMVFQYPEYQLFEETVAGDIAFGPKNMKLAEREIDERVHEAMALVGLDYNRFAQQSPFDLSGGEKRRAALAGILAMRPKYLVLDEPMAGLDPQGRAEILGMLERLRTETHCAIVMVSHSMDDVARHAERIAVLAHGRLAMCDTPSAIFARAEELLSMGLDIPQTIQLARLLRKGGVEVPEGLFRSEALVEYLAGRWRHEH